MEQFIDWLERTLSLIFVPATVWGGAGALYRWGRSDKKSLRQKIVEVSGGAVTTSMLADPVVAYVSLEWHPMVFFLIGWGGLEFVGWMYELMTNIFERRVRRKFLGKDGHE